MYMYMYMYMYMFMFMFMLMFMYMYIMYGYGCVDSQTRTARAPRSQGTRGPRDQETPGPKDQRTKGPETTGQEDQGTRGPRDQGTKGPEDRGPEDQGTRGPRDQRTKGPGDQGTGGPDGRDCRWSSQYKSTIATPFRKQVRHTFQKKQTLDPDPRGDHNFDNHPCLVYSATLHHIHEDITLKQSPESNKKPSLCNMWFQMIANTILSCICGRSCYTRTGYSALKSP